MKETFNKLSATGILFLLPFFVLQAQDYVPYEWQEDRELMTLTEEERAFPLYYLKHLKQYQFLYDRHTDDLVCYTTTHDIIRVANDEALAKSNRIYIPMRNAMELVEIKARAITTDGEQIELDQSNIKELEDEESGSEYRIFAIEGAEVDGEIEYFYTQKVYASYFGSEFFQFSSPVREFLFRLISPENLEYDFRVYNAEGEVLQTDTVETGNRYEYSSTAIPALHEEAFSAYDNSRRRIEFKLAYNSVKGNGRLFTWGDAGKRLYDQIYTLGKSEQKALNKFLKKLNLSGADPVPDLKKAEHYIKTNFFVEENAGDAGSQISFILKNKYGTPRGYTRLFAALATHLGIDHELVMTSNRFDRSFDKDFDTWNYLDEYLIYLKDPDAFLSPGAFAFRIGTVPPRYIATDGLFIHPELIRDYIYPISHIDRIPAKDYRSNFDNLDIQVSFSPSLERNLVEVKRSYKGYNASYYKSSMLVLEEDSKQEMLDEVLKYLAVDAEIEEIEVAELNADYSTWELPFVVEGKFSASSYIEKAGNTVLFKAGQLIGPQSELYQENTRETRVVNDYNRGYLRKIVVNIPDGYTIQNPDDLLLKEQVYEGEELIFNFESTYHIEGQQLKIAIDEFYNRIYYSRDKFDEFRRVINAAADWNKVVLVLKKES